MTGYYTTSSILSTLRNAVNDVMDVGAVERLSAWGMENVRYLNKCSFSLTTVWLGNPYRTSIHTNTVGAVLYCVGPSTHGLMKNPFPCYRHEPAHGPHSGCYTSSTADPTSRFERWLLIHMYWKNGGWAGLPEHRSPSSTPWLNLPHSSHMSLIICIQKQYYICYSMVFRDHQCAIYVAIFWCIMYSNWIYENYMWNETKHGRITVIIVAVCCWRSSAMPQRNWEEKEQKRETNNPIRFLQ